MSDQASVSSLEALKDFRAALASFGTGAQQSLLAVDLEIGRMMEWLTGEQYSFWKMEIRRREEALAEAKVSLSQARMSTMTVSGSPAPCTDQQVAVQKAKIRLEEAEEKFKCVKRWARVIEEELLEYHGPKQQLLAVLDAQVPVACAELERYVTQLEAYLRVTAPSSGPVPSNSSAPPSAPAASGAKPGTGAGKGSASKRAAEAVQVDEHPQSSAAETNQNVGRS